MAYNRTLAHLLGFCCPSCRNPISKYTLLTMALLLWCKIYFMLTPFNMWGIAPEDFFEQISDHIFWLNQNCFFFNVIIVKRFIGVEKILGIKGTVNYVYTCSTKGKTLVSRDKKQDFYLFFFVLVFFYLFFFYQSFCEFLPLDQLNSVNFLAPSGTESD